MSLDATISVPAFTLLPINKAAQDAVGALADEELTWKIPINDIEARVAEHAPSVTPEAITAAVVSALRRERRRRFGAPARRSRRVREAVVAA